ncbi:hypothetical protein GWK48_11125 [Metallosphaera tengchongensis]|uniref:Uncharacterized protein n=2 Tax=Metallosphaera tengchongensis TaxID=1532350 RepID=A0A6N0P0G4_9CREN|nr:hypothetical protein GWK48_11125 [Metallosphaera tengchongensis]
MRVTEVVSLTLKYAFLKWDYNHNLYFHDRNTQPVVKINGKDSGHKTVGKPYVYFK